MAGTGRIPLWLVALVGGLGVIAVVGLFIFGAYSGLGSSI
jgi:photosystem II PsbJ protein